ncbi:MAG: NAD-dependent epimerase/dehydratase family protein [Luteolibacter sp.]
MSPVIVIAGAEGLLGRYACRHFSRLGWEVVAVGRRRYGASCEDEGMFLEWDGRHVGAWAMALEGAEALVNLADVDDRDARVASTRTLAHAVAECRLAPRAWINASTVDWYEQSLGRIHDEWSGEPGTNSESQAALAWEDAFFGADVPPRTRKVAMRMGRILAPETEKLPTLGVSDAWLHMEDFLHALEFLLDDAFFSGAVNVVAPPVNQSMPGVKPLRLSDEGFVWRWKQLTEAMNDLAARQDIDRFFEAMVIPSLGQESGVPAGVS